MDKKMSGRQLLQITTFFLVLNFIVFPYYVFSKPQQMLIKKTSYYVAATGNDENEGTPERPWKTIKKINATDLTPGDNFF